jgi:hypothetical protein
MAGNVIGVIVRLDDGGYLHTFCFRQRQDVVNHVETRINDSTNAGAGAANDIAGTA